MLNRDDISVIILAIIVLATGIIYSNCSLTAIGLALDVSGFIMLWRFGLPSHFKPDGKVANVEWESRKDQTENMRYIFAKWVSRISLVLIIFGFIFQYLGSNQ